MKILVTKRSVDYHASIEGRPEYWGCGGTPAEAMGDLVRAHKEIFWVEIEDKF